MTYTFKYQSPLGRIMLASNGEALTGLWFYGQKYFGDTLPEKYEEKELSVFNETKRWLDNYFQGKKPNFTPPLLFKTTPFRKMVWEILKNYSLRTHYDLWRNL